MPFLSVLHIGEDFCRRIPVIENAGFAVLQTKIALPDIHAAFDHGDIFSAVVFHSDFHAPPQIIVHEARTLSAAPFVLFQNPTIGFDAAEFDLVIPVLTPPAIWIKKLSDVIEASIQLRDFSTRLREECQAVRSRSVSLREQFARNRLCPIDPATPWRGESGKSPESTRPGSSESKNKKS